MPDDTQKLYLISGAPRSGTTMLQKILNTHPEVGCLHEQFGLLEIINNLTISGKKINKNIQIQQKEHYYRDYPSISVHDIPKILKKIWSSVFIDKKLYVIANKIPNVTLDNSLDYYQYDIKLKHIIILRNPIDVINSSITRRNNANNGLDEWHIYSVEQAIDEWSKNWSFASKNFNNPDFFFVKYEDIFTNFEAFNWKISNFMEIIPNFLNLNDTNIPINSKYILDISDLEMLNNYFGVMIKNWSNLSIKEILDPKIRLRHPLVINKLYQIGLENMPVTFSGFSSFELGWIWSVDRTSEINLKIIKAEMPNKLVLDISIYGNKMSYIYAKVDQKSWKKYPLINFDGRKGMVEIDISNYQDDIGVDISILFYTPVYKKPNDDPKNDQRPLRFAIHSMCLS